MAEYLSRIIGSSSGFQLSGKELRIACDREGWYVLTSGTIFQTLEGKERFSSREEAMKFAEYISKE